MGVGVIGALYRRWAPGQAGAAVERSGPGLWQSNSYSLVRRAKEIRGPLAPGALKHKGLGSVTPMMEHIGQSVYPSPG
jgi:hypothetical protein